MYPMQKKYSAMRGFTLIELLVVIAIIGILSAVVLASLNTARQKGSDAAIKSDLGTIRTQASLDYTSNNNSYTPGGASVGSLTTAATAPVPYQTGPAGNSPLFGNSTTPGDLTVGNSLNNAIQQSGVVYYMADQNHYIVEAKLTGTGAAAGTSDWWCVDGNGNAEQLHNAASATAAPETDVTKDCNGTSY